MPDPIGLPRELAHHVFSFLGDGCPAECLPVLARVSRAWRNEARDQGSVEALLPVRHLVACRWENMRCLEQAPALQTLRCFDSPATAWPRLPHLRLLHLERCRWFTDEALAGLASKCPRLLALTVVECPRFRGRGLGLLTELRCCRLVAAPHTPTYAGVYLPELLQLTHLVRLSLQGQELRHHLTAVADLVAACPELAELKLRRCGLVDEHLQRVREPPPALRCLDVRGNWGLTRADRPRWGALERVRWPRC